MLELSADDQDGEYYAVSRVGEGGVHAPGHLLVPQQGGVMLGGGGTRGNGSGGPQLSDSYYQGKLNNSGLIPFMEVTIWPTLTNLQLHY